MTNPPEPSIWGVVSFWGNQFMHLFKSPEGYATRIGVHTAWLLQGFLSTGPMNSDEAEQFDREIYSAVEYLALLARPISLSMAEAEHLNLDFNECSPEMEISWAMGQWLRSNQRATLTDFCDELNTKVEAYFGESTALRRVLNVFLTSNTNADKVWFNAIHP